jgi:hypothetical protein
MPKSFWQDPMKTTLALAAAQKAEHQTDHCRTTTLFSAFAVLRRLDRAIWHFLITQAFIRALSAWVKPGSLTLFGWWLLSGNL